MSMQVSVIIVNWNAGPQLADCVASIAQYHCGLVSSLIVVDNASTDDSLAQVEALERLPFQLVVVRNNDNHGFGAACNHGATLAASEYLVFLNPDTRLFDGSLSAALEYLQDSDSQDVGIVGIQLLDEQNKITRSCARFPSTIGFLAHAIGIDRIFPRFGHFMAEWAHDTTCEVDHVIGAFYFVRRKVFDSLNGFDEQFFVYLEDLDFSYRARQKGWRSIFLANVRAFHAGGGTSNQVKARRLFYSLRSRLLYSFKHFNFFGAMAVLLVTLLLEPLSRSSLALARRSLTSLQETWTGYGMLWRWLPQWIFKGVKR